MATLCTSTWGDPNATKHALLIHGIMNSSQTCYRIAQEFASRGYFVVAPDLLGHGNARRGSDYTIAELVEELRPLFMTPKSDDHPFDVVVGLSLGGVVATALLPLLKSTRPVRVVLGDPPLQMTPETRDFYRRGIFEAVRNPRSPEDYLKMFPTWTKEQAAIMSLGMHLCDPDGVEAIYDRCLPGAVSHHLSSIPENVQVVVLAADPSMMPCVRAEDLEPYRDVKVQIVSGASHRFLLERPMVIVEAALEGTEAPN